ncbi:MAG: hypothetical protein NC311_17980 [Muribaculaceae bacterium]|nr:hypothetical protein [Muribaculaceae bacterium]
MNFQYKKALAAIAIMTMVTSCSDDKWEPGPDVDPSCMTVYFEPLSNYDIILEPDDSRLIPVTIGRAKIDEAASVDIKVISAPEGVVVPSSVDFAAGEQSKTIFIDLENMASKSSGTISLELPEEMTSPYGAGNSAINVNVTVSGAWILLDDNVYFSFAKHYQPVYGKIYILEGTYNFKIPNFLNSGLDLQFTVDNPGEGNLKVIPLKNFIDYKDYFGPDYSYDGWLFYNQEEQYLPEWSPDGSYPNITGMEIDYDYGTISIYNNDKGLPEGYMQFTPFISYSDASSGYDGIYVYFDPAFNPFADNGTKE